MTLCVNFFKALGATSIQMQDVCRDLNQHLGSEPWEKVGIRSFNLNLSLFRSEFHIPQFGRTWIAGRGKICVGSLQQAFECSSLEQVFYSLYHSILYS